MKRIVTVVLALAMIFSLSACGTKDSENGKMPEKLVLGFVPLMDGDKLIESVKPLSEILTKAIGIPVEAFTATNYVGVVEAMGSGKVDFGIIPPFAYLLAHKESNANVVLSALNKHGKPTYKTEFLVLKDSGIESVKDLHGKKVAFVDPASASGYLYPGAKLIEEGLDLEKDISAVFSGGHDKSLQLLMNKDVDCACVYEGALNKFKDSFPSLLTDSVVMDTTKDIPYITVTCRGGMDEELQNKIRDGIMQALNEGEGHDICVNLFSLYGFQPATDADYESVRTTAELMKIDLREQK